MPNRNYTTDDIAKIKTLEKTNSPFKGTILIKNIETSKLHFAIFILILEYVVLEYK